MIKEPPPTHTHIQTNKQVVCLVELNMELVLPMIYLHITKDSEEDKAYYLMPVEHTCKLY